MESLESRLARLSLEQRKEVEDFVDYLVSRSTNPVVPRVTAAPMPPVMNAAPPAFPAQEFGSIPVMTETPVVQNSGLIRQPEACDNRLLSPDEPEEEVIHEITVECSDPVTRDYLDYGQFEDKRSLPLSPAAEAVQRVKAKMAEKKEPAPGTHLLEWID